MKKSGKVIPHRLAWHGRFLAWLAYVLLRLLYGTIRFSVSSGTTALEHAVTGPVIFAIWHNRLALCMRVYHWYFLREYPGRQLSALISASKDGALLARVLKYFKVAAVRGSSSRRGPQALLELRSVLEGGSDVAITPDGPRGPAYKVQPGIIWLAQVTGRPILPASWNLESKVSAKSWDRFQIPLPFAKTELLFADPIHVPREATEEDRERFRQELERRLGAMTRD